MIDLAKLSELHEILQVTDDCRIAMEKKGIYQWTTAYPSRKAFKNDIERKELYVLKNNLTIIGCVVLSTHMDVEYTPVSWLTPNTANYYVHRLAVHPNFQGKGYAQRLMDFAEDFALKNKAISIRLDTFSQNKRNQKFYEQRGYVKLGDIFFPNQSEHPFHCYELVL
ncbi:GNAT family N-acetyltransferase [Maribacter sp. LLG6340-A2]|uniref:GNAT family N-acetyltransferase n=1 Tax=Maribacter sp. LLG6340-A2 TaxID=3160834 RepID=UPI00386F96AD